MKNIPLIILVGLLTGCHSNLPSAAPPARSTLSQYQQIYVGMRRNEIYQLLGQPRGGYVEGANVPTEIWVDTPGNHGKANRLSVLFGADGRAMNVEIDTVTTK
jgi:hypothetical protein